MSDNGAILDWMKQNGEKIDHCLVTTNISFENGRDDENRMLAQ